MRHVLLVILAAGCQTTTEPATTPGATPLGEPGAFALRRLNRAEYDRTVRDLLHTTQQPGRDFPADDSAHGFDNVAEALAMSPLYLELAEAAAARLITEAMDAPLQAPVDWTFEPESDDAFTSDAAWGGPTAEGYRLSSQGALSRPVLVPKTGAYTLTAEVSAQQAGPDPARASLLVDGLPVHDADVEVSWGEGWQTLSTEVTLGRGQHTVAVTFDDDYGFDDTDLDTDVPQDRNLFVDRLGLAGPLDFEVTPNPAYERLMVCPLDGDDDRACARRVLEAFTPRAWRRSIADTELDRLMGLYDEVVDAGDPPRWGLEFALRAVLTSPHFLFLVEPAATAEVTPVSDHVLATRLSYFLWGSMPDDTLRAVADEGTLHQPEVLRAQVERMLRDDRAQALVSDFAGQWLGIRAVDDIEPDVWTFPGWSEALRASMKEEMERQFASFLGSDRPLTELLDGDSTFIDNRLADLYGIDTRRGFDEWWPYGTGGLERRGWLGTAGWLASTSYPTRTSPIRRGVWVLDQLLCEEPQPPPPGVEGLPDPEGDAPSTLREQLERHRADPVCATCHDKIDPVGFAFEHFDGIGAWRDTEQDLPIDASGTLPDGTPLADHHDLITVLADDPRFTECLVERAFTFAHHRGPTEADEAHLARIHQRFLDEGGTFDALATAIATSETFRHRQGVSE